MRTSARPRPGRCLRRRFDHRVLLQRGGRLCQQAAVDGGPGQHRDIGLGQDAAFEMRVRVERHGAGDLPENVLGLGAAAEHDVHVRADIEFARDLENPDIVRTAGQGQVGRDRDVRAPGVGAGDQGLIGYRAGADVQEGPDAGRPAGGVGVGGLHVADGGGQQHRIGDGAGRAGRVGGVDDAAHFRAADADEGAADRTGSDIAADGRRRHVGDAGLGQHREVAGAAEDHRRRTHGQVDGQGLGGALAFEHGRDQRRAVTAAGGHAGDVVNGGGEQIVRGPAGGGRHIRARSVAVAGRRSEALGGANGNRRVDRRYRDGRQGGTGDGQGLGAVFAEVGGRDDGAAAGKAVGHAAWRHAGHAGAGGGPGRARADVAGGGVAISCRRRELLHAADGNRGTGRCHRERHHAGRRDRQRGRRALAAEGDADRRRAAGDAGGQPPGAGDGGDSGAVRGPGRGCGHVPGGAVGVGRRGDELQVGADRHGGRRRRHRDARQFSRRQAQNGVAAAAAGQYGSEEKPH